MANLWDNDDPVSNLGIDVPPWIDQDITPYDVAAICQGGCASGAYMPAVTYYQALETMNEHGDDIFEYIESIQGEILFLTDTAMCWSGMAVFYVSFAVELWASSVEDEISNALDALADDDDSGKQVAFYCENGCQK